MRTPLFLAAGPLAIKIDSLMAAEEVDIGAVDTKVTLLNNIPRPNVMNALSGIPTFKRLAGSWDKEAFFIDDAGSFIREAKKKLSVPVFGNFKENSQTIENWVTIARRLEDAEARRAHYFFNLYSLFRRAGSKNDGENHCSGMSGR
jgi:hypothetical protein